MRKPWWVPNTKWRGSSVDVAAYLVTEEKIDEEKSKVRSVIAMTDDAVARLAMGDDEEIQFPTDAVVHHRNNAADDVKEFFDASANQMLNGDAAAVVQLPVVALRRALDGLPDGELINIEIFTKQKPPDDGGIVETTITWSGTPLYTIHRAMFDSALRIRRVGSNDMLAIVGAPTHALYTEQRVPDEYIAALPKRRENDVVPKSRIDDDTEEALIEIDEVLANIDEGIADAGEEETIDESPPVKMQYAGTTTGRFKSDKPNLTAMPPEEAPPRQSRAELLRQLRSRVSQTGD